MIVKRTSSLAGVHSEQDGFFSPAPPSRIYSHITIYVPGRGRLTVTCASLEGASLATSQEIDQMLATLPFSGHTLAFLLKALMVCPTLPTGGAA